VERAAAMQYNTYSLLFNINNVVNNTNYTVGNGATWPVSSTDRVADLSAALKLLGEGGSHTKLWAMEKKNIWRILVNGNTRNDNNILFLWK
jgi:hypothetical protein